jgi:hypothetical protein
MNIDFKLEYKWSSDFNKNARRYFLYVGFKHANAHGGFQRRHVGVLLQEKNLTNFWSILDLFYTLYKTRKNVIRSYKSVW